MQLNKLTNMTTSLFECSFFSASTGLEADVRYYQLCCHYSSVNIKYFNVFKITRLNLAMGSKFEWRVGPSDTILKGDHPKTIPAKFGLIWFNGFRGEDLNVKALDGLLHN
jgi:hypothetical protein